MSGCSQAFGTRRGRGSASGALRRGIRWWMGACLVAAAARPAAAQVAAETVTGVVRSPDGQPAADVEVKLQQLTVRTAADGTFVFPYPRQALFGQTVVASNAAGDLQGYQFFMWQRTGNETLPETIELTLEPPVVVRAQVVDGDGKTIAGVRVGAIADYSHVVFADTDTNGRAEFRIPKAARLRTVFAKQAQAGFDYVTLISEQQFFNNPGFKSELPVEPVQLVLDGARTVDVTLLDGDGKPIANTGIYPWLFRKQGNAGEQFNTAFVVSEFSVTTSSSGVATFDWLPTWEKSPEFIFWPMVNNQHQNQRRGTFDMSSGADRLTIQIERGVHIGGIVQRAGGAPVPGVMIMVRGIGPDNNQFGNGVQTGADGRYQVEVPPGSMCMLIVDDPNWAAEIKAGVSVQPKTDINNLDFELRAPTTISGRVTVGSSNRPLANQQVTLEQSGMDTNSNPELLKSRTGNQYLPPLNHYRQTMTDAEGRYEFKVGPGRYLLRGTRNASAQQFVVRDEAALRFDFKADRADRGPFAVHVVSGTPAAGVADATVDIRAQNQWWSENLHQTDSTGHVRTERNLIRTFVYARSADARQAAIVEVGADDESAVVELQPTGVAVGRLVAAAGNSPLRNTDFFYGVRPDPGVTLYGGVGFAGGSSKTDGDGRFKLSNLVLNRDYSIDVALPNQPGMNASSVFAVSAAGEKDVGDVKVASNAQPVVATPANAPVAVAAETGGTSLSQIVIIANLIAIPLIAIGFFIWQRRG